MTALDGITEIQPGQSATVNIVMQASHGSDGKTISLTQEIAYRVVKEADVAGDAGLPERTEIEGHSYRLV